MYEKCQKVLRPVNPKFSEIGKRDLRKYFEMSLMFILRPSIIYQPLNLTDLPTNLLLDCSWHHLKYFTFSDMSYETIGVDPLDLNIEPLGKR